MPCFFFGCANMKCMLCKSLFFISNSRIQVVKGEKMLEHVWPSRTTPPPQNSLTCRPRIAFAFIIAQTCHYQAPSTDMGCIFSFFLFFFQRSGLLSMSVYLINDVALMISIHILNKVFF